MEKRVPSSIVLNTEKKSARRVFPVSSAANPGQRMLSPLPISLKQPSLMEKADVTLRQSHAFIESLLEHLPIMVFVKDANDLRFIYFNKAGEDLLGYSRFELLGKNDYDFFPKQEANFFTNRDREVLSSGHLLDIPEEPIQTRYKGGRLLHTKKIPIFDADGTPQYLLGISEDITNQRRAEQILWKANADLESRVIQRTADLVKINTALQKESAERRAAEKTLQDLSMRLISAQEEERSRIARDLHDDVCQRLALMTIEVEQLGQPAPDSESQHNARCHNLCKKIRELSADLHDLSHELHPSKLDHLGLVAAVKSFCSEIMRRYQVSIVCVCHGVPDSLSKSIALSLFRVTQEAVYNFVKHSGVRDAHVNIRGHAGMISLTISDSGTGFDPGSRVPTGGLGLTSMRERVRQMGGTLSLHSSPSRGTRIEVRVPLRTSASSS